MRPTNDAPLRGFQLRFDALSVNGRDLTFPCDARGNVDLDELSDGLRRTYLYAHTLIGRDYAMRIVQPC